MFPQMIEASAAYLVGAFLFASGATFFGMFAVARMGLKRWLMGNAVVTDIHGPR